MADISRYNASIGWIGVLCLALYWTARFVPEVADSFPLSSVGKFVVFGIFLAGVPLTIIAAIRGSKWWWVAVAAGALTLLDLYIHFFQVKS